MAEDDDTLLFDPVEVEERINQDAEYLRKKCREHSVPTPVGFLVLGSGIPFEGEELFSLDYNMIPWFPIPTVAGHPGRISFVKVGNIVIAVLRGRVHGYDGWNPWELVHHVRVMARLGANNFAILTSAVGGIDRLDEEPWQVGDFALIRDHINFTGKNVLVGPNIHSFGPRFPSMTRTYSKILGRHIEETAIALNFEYEEGWDEEMGTDPRVIEMRPAVLGLMGGPQYETPAEIRALRQLGADVVGMSLVHEATALAHMGVPTAGISVISNVCAKRTNGPEPNHEEVKEAMTAAGPRVGALLTRTIATIGQTGLLESTTT